MTEKKQILLCSLGLYIVLAGILAYNPKNLPISYINYLIGIAASISWSFLIIRFPVNKMFSALLFPGAMTLATFQLAILIQGPPMLIALRAVIFIILLESFVRTMKTPLETP